MTREEDASNMTREEELSAELSQKDAELAKAKRMMVALNNKVKAKLAAQDAKMKEEGERFREVIESLKTDLEKARASGASAEPKEPASEDDQIRLIQADWESERLQLEQQIQEKDNIILEKISIIDMAKEKFLKQGEKARSLIQDRDEQIALKEQEIVELNEQISALNASISASDSETPSLKAQVCALEESLRSASVAIETKENAILTQAQEIESFKTLIADLKLQNDRVSSVSEDLKLSVEKCCKELAETKEALASSSTKLQQMELELLDAQKRITAFEEEVEGSQSQQIQAEGDLTEMRSKLQSAEEKILEAEIQVSILNFRTNV
jgi:chromosome segregation ATPase